MKPIVDKLRSLAELDDVTEKYLRRDEQARASLANMNPRIMASGSFLDIA
jgi:hypothetical protein